ncbi:AMP-dependent synthetase/ligase [Aurantibacillus circumpalustris]|uniref:AMP-dependent synthetase/ligase n=1 Tax=Aurantibacillus circumpalustris TaxID=3036359 RepID=UPI00295B3992|nr:long-chain fatty acid--CoA ligase [Aurantibacillus circumpalustris]
MDSIENFRLFDFLHHLKKLPAKSDTLAAKENGVWRKYSTDEYIDTVNALSYAFLDIGIQRGDKIGLISNNRPEWNFIDYACSQTGTINTPLYPTISEHDLKHVIGDADIKYFFVANEEIYERVKSCAANSSVIEIFSIPKIKGLRNIQELIAIGKKNPQVEKLEAIKKSIKNSDLATLIYTSGTTGNPKGVMLSHNNFVSNVLACKDLCPFESDWRALSFLPLNHVYERMLSYLYISRGMSVYYAESLEKIGENLKEVKPHIFVTVPRLLEKVYEKIVATGTQLEGIKRVFFFWALKLGLKYEQHGANGWWYEFQLKIVNKLVFSKWREALGGNIVAIVSGGSALQIPLARVFHAARIKILEGYGLTETSPVVAVNNYADENIMIGTVGPIVSNVQVKFSDEGEICVKGPNVMMGYYNRPDLTAEVIDSDGWFHTGDIGTLVDNKFLKITDRKKEMFKTSGGKYITPQITENKLKGSRFIEQAMVIGENEKFPAAFVVPAFAFIKTWCEKHNIPYTNSFDIIKNEQVRARVMKEVEIVNKDLSQHERIKKIELLSDEWTIEKGEMTPKLSLKRKIILNGNKDAYDKIYRSENAL